MINFIFPLVMLFVLVAITVFLFWKLKLNSIYNVVIYGALFFFWMSQAVISNEAADTFEPSWTWPLLVGLYQLTQVFTRLPFGMLSRKLKSRKIPIAISTLCLVLGLFINVIWYEHDWSKYVAMVGAGVFGGSFGMQNTYWSENNDFKKVFMTVAIMGMLPTLGDYTAKTLIKSTYFMDPSASFEAQHLLTVDITRWILLASGVLSAFALGYYLFFVKEKTEKIRLNDMTGKNEKIASFRTPKILFNCIATLLAAISFEAIKATAINRYVIEGSGSMDPNDATIISLVVSGVTAIVTVLVSLIFIRKIRSYVLTMIAQGIMVTSLIFGVVIVTTGFINLYTWIIFIFFSSVGYAMFMPTMFGTMMHIDHRNKLLVLGIWLTVRSFGMFAGQFISNELVILVGDSTIEWIFIAALIISVGSLIFSLLRYKFGEKEVFDLVDREEYDKYHVNKENTKLVEK